MDDLERPDHLAESGQTKETDEMKLVNAVLRVPNRLALAWVLVCLLIGAILFIVLCALN